MLGVVVARSGGKSLSPEEPVYYDETVEVKIESKAEEECEVHVTAAVLGKLQDRRDQLVVTIFETTLPPNKSWTLPLHVRHPRSPLQNPHIEIAATALDKATSVEPDEPPASDLILKPFEPVPASAWNKPYSLDDLEWSAVSRVGSRRTSQASVTSSLSREESKTSKKAESKFTAPLKQALELGMRCVRPVLEKDRLIAELDVSSSQKVVITRCSLTVDEGTSTHCGPVSFPINLDAGGAYCFCYKLQTVTASPSLRKSLEIVLEYSILDDGKPNPEVSTIWRPIVDFDDTQGPLPKTPMLAIPSSPVTPLGGPTFQQPGSARGSTTSLAQLTGSSSLAGNQRFSQQLLNGVSLLITSPTSVKCGDTFGWSIKAINRSPRPRKIALSFGAAASGVPFSAVPASTADDRTLIVSNLDVLRRRDELYRQASGAHRGILTMCNEVRIGVLAPNSCYETSMTLVGLKRGVHSVNSVTVVDLNTGDFYEVGELLEVEVV